MAFEWSSEVARVVVGVFGPRRRRWSVHGGRLHAEVRVATHAEACLLDGRLAEAVQSDPRVAWTAIDPFGARAVVACDPVALPPEELVALIARCEAECGFGDRGFRTDLPEHPADLEPLVRLAMELAADGVGFWMAILGRIASLRVLAAEVDLLAVTSVLEGMPTLRRFVDERFGPQASSLWLGIATAFAQGLAQSPMGPLVDVAYRSTQAAERLARRRLWRERAATLYARPPVGPLDASDPEARPTPLPAGPIERYADMAFAGSLGAFGLGFATTGSLADSSAALLGGLPRPARLGREAFAALLGRTLARRGLLTLDPGVLRRFDRIDCLLVPHALTRDPDWPVVDATARAAGLVVEIAADDMPLADAVRRQQRRGRVVFLVADGPPGALAAADAAMGLITRTDGVPWDAHVLAGDRPIDAIPVLHACAAARTVAQQSVMLAEAGVGLGILATFGERLAWATTSRVMLSLQVATLLAMGNGARHALGVSLAPAAVPRDATPWHALDPAEALARLGSTTAGLSAAEAGARARPPVAPPTFLRRLAGAVVDELANPLTPVLAAGAGLSAAIGAVTDAALVGAVMVIDAAVGAVERLRAELAITELRAERPRTVRLMRDGVETVAEVAALVPGDVIHLGAGEFVPADCRILTASGLEVDESSLTGESLPVVKGPAPVIVDAVAERTSVLYEGTAIAAGQVTAVAFGVGEATEARAAAAAGVPPKTGVEARLESLLSLTTPGALATGVATTIAGIVRGQPLAESLSTGVSLAVAAVPEGLPLLATMAQLSAARRLSDRGALVRNPRAIEALGRATVVCLDKTGTVTEGCITLRVVSDGHVDMAVGHLDAAARAILRTALRATPWANGAGATVPHGTDRAVTDAAEAAAVDHGAWGAVTELPFESTRGFHATLGNTPIGLVLCVKGAPEVVLPRCTATGAPDAPRPLDAHAAAHLDDQARRLARAGLRVLAVAEADIPTNGSLTDERVAGLTFRGFLGLGDTLRPTAAAAIAALRSAGVRLVMLTGDHPTTAESIGAELGLLDGGTVLTGAIVDDLDDAALAARVAETTIFARVTPRHKARLVRAFQRAGFVVAMTGDGANDAAAIRLADVGIALGSRCTTAARQAADIVVTDDRIETLVDAVLEGRAMWASVRDAVALLLGGNLGEVLFTLGAAVAGGGTPLNARQLLLVNLLTDTAPALAIALRPPPAVTPEQLLHEGPEASLGTPLVRDVAWRAFVTATGASAAWLLARPLGTRRSTVALVTLVGTQLGQTLVAGGRSPIVVVSGVGAFAALGGIVQIPGVSHFFGCRPLGPLGWAIAGGTSLVATGASVIVPRILPRIAPWFDALLDRAGIFPAPGGTGPMSVNGAALDAVAS